jgi:hypothetical protein
MQRVNFQVPAESQAVLSQRRRPDFAENGRFISGLRAILIPPATNEIGIFRKLVLWPGAFLLTLTFFIGARELEAQVVHKKEAYPQLSSEQYQRIESLHPDATKPVYVVLRAHVMRGDVVKVDPISSCGVSEVDQFALKWVWNTYHYNRNFSGEKTVKVRVNSPILRDPQARLSWRAWQEVYRADPFKRGTRFISRFSIVIRQGKIVDVQLVTSSGLPLVDQEFRNYIRTRWVPSDAANVTIPASMTAHRGYYPG